MGLPVWMLGWDGGRLEADKDRLIALLLHQHVLDEQFMQLQQLQDEETPNFVSEVVSIYLRQSEKLIISLRELIAERECTDYKKIEVHLNKLKGSSSSIGAKRVRHLCVAFGFAAEHNNWMGCLRSLALLEYEYCYLKNKLHEFLQIEQQRAIASGVRYPQPLE